MSKESLVNLLERCIQLKSHESGKIVHARILRTGFSSDTFLCNRLIDFYSKCSDITSPRHVFDSMLRRDVFSWNAMLGSFCAANDLEDAYKLFDKMPERNVVSWNSMISAFVKNGDDLMALDFYTAMIWEGFLPTRFTLASVLSACGALLDAGLGRLCHGLAVKIGIDRNIYVSNALLSMYSKCRCVEDAVKAFAGLEEPNEVSFTAMMGSLAEAEKVEEALEMFKLMHRTRRICIDAVSLSSILGVCARGGIGESDFSDANDRPSVRLHGQLIHSLSVKLGFESDFHLSNSMLDMYAKNGDMANAETLFHRLSVPSTVSWNIMIAGYGQIYRIDKAAELMERMICCGCEPDEVTFINLLFGCIRAGDIVVGRQVFDRMTCPSLTSWNAMLSGYSQVENHDQVIMLFREMQLRNIKPDKTTLVVVLGSCAAMELLDFGKQVHAVSQKFELHGNLYVGSALISLYSKSRKMETALFIFHSLPELDIACWNSIIAGFSFNHLHEEAVVFFNLMRRKDVFPNEFSYATLLSCCAGQSLPSQGRQIHAQIVKDGYMDNIFVGSALIDMYCKCGGVDEARHIFDSMPSRNTVPWNEMIHGYAQNGRGDEAVRLYNDMIKSGEEPDDITFVSVLTSCSHSGLVDEGLKIFKSISVVYKVEPLLDHCTCIIDALGRAGRLHEAETLITKMPYKDDPVIWEVLLSSCRVHTDVPVARRAAGILFSINPQNPTPYVLLANVYSSMGRWDDATAVRELMTDEHVGKEAGYSWM
ncbi:hypothetical protein Dimus_009139 [Dionaea muscipula]